MTLPTASEQEQAIPGNIYQGIRLYLPPGQYPGNVIGIGIFPGDDPMSSPRRERDVVSSMHTKYDLKHGFA